MHDGVTRQRHWIDQAKADMDTARGPGSSARPSSLACNECRRKHLKCDGTRPICTRCRQDRSTCDYTPSRRGYGRRRTTAKQGSCVAPSPHSLQHHHQQVSPDQGDLHDITVSPGQGTSFPQQALATPNSSTSRVYEGGSNLINDANVAAYYALFHDAHPVLVPHSSFVGQHYPTYLRLLVCFIGQHCAAQGVNYESHSGEIDLIMDSYLDESTVSRVQALVLHAIMLHSMHRPDRAIDAVCRAEALASRLGLNEPAFAGQYPDPVSADSVRRTWWELYVAESYFGALHRQGNERMSNLTTFPHLPNDDSTSVLITLNTFENRCFAATPLLDKWSSHGFRIEAARLMRRVTALAPHACLEDVQSIETTLASWQYYVPHGKEPLNTHTGTIDAVMIQASMFVACAKIFLHFPRSALPPTVPKDSNITCAPSHQSSSTSGPSQHSAKAILASNDIATLAALPCSEGQHSPFFVCALILGCIVQIAASHTLDRTLAQARIQQCKERVILLLGVLNHMGQCWTVARNAHSILSVLAASAFLGAQEVLELARDSPMSLTDVPDDLSWFDLFSPEFSQLLP